MAPSEIINANIRTEETIVSSDGTVYADGAFGLSFKNEVGNAIATLWKVTVINPGDPIFALTGLVTGAGPGQVLVTPRTDIIPVSFGAGTAQLIVYRTFIDNIDICKPGM